MSRPRHSSPPLLFRRLFLPLLAACAWLSPVRGQDPDTVELSANVLNNRVAIGEFGTLIVKLTGGTADLPETISARGLEIGHSGEQSAVGTVNGVQMIETSHFYRFRGSEPGEYTIPSISVEVGRLQLETKPIDVEVYERDEDEAVDATRPFFAKLELTQTEFYVNEIIPFTVTSYVRGRNSISDVVQPRFEHESFVIRGFRDVRTDGGELGSTYYSSAALPSSLFALKPGEHRLGPAELGVRVLDSSTGFGFSSFFSRTVLREMATNTIRVTVRPLPDGAPRSFGGGVGNFQLSAEASTTSVSVGDPISMTFRVTGTGNRETLSAPVFATPQTDIWRTYDPSKEMEDVEGSDGFESATVTFQQVIIPEARVEQIPPFELTYFDPAAAEYVTRRTDPIPVEVRSDSSSNAAPAISFPSSGDSQAPATATPAPSPRFEDMLHIRMRNPRWIAAADLGSPGILFYAMHAVFSLCFFTVAGFALVRWLRKRQSERDFEGDPETFQEALARIPRPGASRRDYYRAVSVALDRWKRENDDAPPGVLEVIQRVSSKCNELLYSGVEGAETPTTREEAAEFQSILQKLSRQ